MNLFESLQLITETSTFESKVDYDLLKQNDIDFFENGAGVYRITTPDGDILDIDIELSNSPTDVPKYFVSLPSEDVRTVNVDLTTAIIDVINKLMTPPPIKKGSKKHAAVMESNNGLWRKFNNRYDGFIPIQDLVNYFSLDQFGEFIQWCKREADMDYDDEKKYTDWNEAMKDLDMATGLDDTDSISLENIFNFFSQSDLEELWNWVEKEYDLDNEELDESIKLEKLSIGNKLQTVFDKFDSNIKLVGFMLKYIDEDIIEKMYNDIVGVEEATSGIGGAYTTKAIDILPSTLNVRDKKYKTESVFKMWDEEFDEDKIAKDIKYTKENKDSQFALMTVKYQDEDIYLVNDGEFSLIDDKDCMLYLGYNENMDKFLVYFEIKNIEVTSYPEDGPDADEFDYEINEIPYKITRI